MRTIEIGWWTPATGVTPGIRRPVRMITLPSTSSRRMPVRGADVVRALGRDRRRLDAEAGLAHRRGRLGARRRCSSRGGWPSDRSKRSSSRSSPITSGSSTRSACSSSSWPVWSPSRTTIVRRSGIAATIPAAASLPLRADAARALQLVRRRRRAPTTASARFEPAGSARAVVLPARARRAVGHPGRALGRRRRHRRGGRAARRPRPLRPVRRAAGRHARPARPPPRRAPDRRRLLPASSTCWSGPGGRPLAARGRRALDARRRPGPQRGTAGPSSARRRSAAKTDGRASPTAAAAARKRAAPVVRLDDRAATTALPSATPADERRRAARCRPRSRRPRARRRRSAGSPAAISGATATPASSASGTIAANDDGSASGRYASGTARPRAS